jgi:hypothetical protein
VTGTAALRRAVTGLLGFAAAEEQALLAADAAGPGASGGGPDRWAAAPLVAHHNQFKHQQAERVRCVLAGQVPPAYGEIDHSSAEVYRGYLGQPPGAVLADCRRVTAELIDGTWALTDEDLLDPARHSWLNGRLLWLQIVVRGFWHPAGHLGDYYLTRGQAGYAVAMQAHGLATARYLCAPAAAAGMAGYNLACAQARAGRTDEATGTLRDAIAANPDLRANAGRDTDLEFVREAFP